MVLLRTKRCRRCEQYVLFMLATIFLYIISIHLAKSSFFCIVLISHFTMLRVKHECDIITEDILFPPDRNFFQKMYDDFRYLLMASNKNPGACKYLRSHASILSEKRRHLRNYRYIIHPFSMFRYYWDFTMILIMSCLLFAVPYQATFEVSKRSPYWTFFKNFLLFFCCIDVTVNFMTGYFDEMHHIVVMEQKQIMRRYLKRSIFLPDLLGSLMTDIVFVAVWQRFIVTRELVSLICGFRVFSLTSYTRKIALVYDVPIALYKVCIVIFWLIIALHWQSCLYWLMPIATTSMYLPERPGNNSWLHEFDLWEESKARQYLSSLLRAISTFLSSGFLHSKPRDEMDLTLVIISQIFGSLIIWILIAYVKLFSKGANGSKMKYRNIISQLKQYMHHRQLPHTTQHCILAYYEFCFQQRYFREVEILNILSMQMRQEINMHACRKLVENVTFFNNLPLALLTRIVALLKSEIFLTNDVIVRANQPGDCMYFIATGTVAIYTSSGKEVCHLEDGAHFGEIVLVMPEERRVASVVAVEICELYRLDRADFARTIHPYPMLWEQIKKIAIERHERTTILNVE